MDIDISCGVCYNMNNIKGGDNMNKNADLGKLVLFTSILCFVFEVISIYVLGVAFITGLIGILALSMDLLREFLVRYIIAFVLSVVSMVLGLFTISKYYRLKELGIKRKKISLLLAIIGTICAFCIIIFILHLLLAWLLVWAQQLINSNQLFGFLY